MFLIRASAASVESMDIVKVYIINLKHRTDRKKNVSKHLINMGFSKKKIKFINATDRSQESWIKSLNEIFSNYSRPQIANSENIHHFIGKKYVDIIRNGTENERKKVQGEIGCSLSHLRIHSMIYKQKIFGNYLILEDDIVPTKYWYDYGVNDSLINKSKSMLTYVGDCFRTDVELNKKITISGSKQQLVSYITFCTHAYIINNAFSVVINGYLNKIFPLRMPVDWVLPSLLKDLRIPFYIFKEPLLDQDLSFETDIQMTGDDKKM